MKRIVMTRDSKTECKAATANYKRMHTYVSWFVSWLINAYTEEEKYLRNKKCLFGTNNVNWISIMYIYSYKIFSRQGNINFFETLAPYESKC